MVELCLVCGEPISDAVEPPVMTEDGWTHMECVDAEDLADLLLGLDG